MSSFIPTQPKILMVRKQDVPDDDGKFDKQNPGVARFRFSCTYEGYGVWAHGKSAAEAQANLDALHLEIARRQGFAAAANEHAGRASAMVRHI
jgi:hypothetical protein